MKPKEFDRLKIGDTIYRFDEEIRSYTLTHKTHQSLHIDRPCVLSSAIVVSGAGRKLMRLTAQKYFWITRLEALSAERERLREILYYCRTEKEKALEALRNLNDMGEKHEG